MSKLAFRTATEMTGFLVILQEDVGVKKDVYIFCLSHRAVWVRQILSHVEFAYCTNTPLSDLAGRRTGRVQVEGLRPDPYSLHIAYPSHGLVDCRHSRAVLRVHMKPLGENIALRLAMSNFRPYSGTVLTSGGYTHKDVGMWGALQTM